MQVALGNDVFAEVDDTDFGKVWSVAWKAVVGEYTTYAYNPKLGYLHRMLLGLQAGDPREVDHIDSNGLNCKRDNLRIATSSQNKANRTRTNQYKGVRWREDKQKWVAQLKSKYLGYFDDPIEAAKAYDKAAKARFGDYAKLNFPEERP